MKIQETKEYSIFQKQTGNRKLEETHLINLEKSIKESNLLPSNPIIVTSDMEIIDGQHRLEVARRLKIAIYYVVVDKIGVKEMQLLNTYAKAWTLTDYVKCYAQLGYQDYELLLAFQERYELPISMCIGLLGGALTDTRSSSMDEGTITYKTKRGLFKITELKEAEMFITDLVKFIPYLENPKILRSRDFIRAVGVIRQKDILTIDQLIKKMKVMKHVITRKRIIRDYLRDFEDIYNHKRTNKINLSI